MLLVLWWDMEQQLIIEADHRSVDYHVKPCYVL
jgi:hypothetical protein